MLEKKKSHAFGKDTYLLGKDKDGTYYWLEEAKWDCGWYWGFGYVETYTNNKNPEMAIDINSHQHFDRLFFRADKMSYDAFKEFFEETVLTDKEIWKLLELMQSFYTAEKYAELVYRGGSHYTNNPCSIFIKDEKEYTRINKVMIPAICDEVYRLLSSEVVG